MKYVLMGAVLVYAADWAVFEVRQLRGTGMGSVQVEQYLSTALKGNKNQYDYLGTTNEGCARSLFPQYAQSNWNPPCWWLERHREKWE